MEVQDLNSDQLAYLADKFRTLLLSLGRQRARPSDIVNGLELEIYVNMSTVLFYSICSHINHGINE